MPIGRFLLVLGLAVLAVAGPARAATLTGSDRVLAFTAGRGEANRLTVHVVGPKHVRVSDPGARLHVRAPCVALSAHRADCRMRFQILEGTGLFAQIRLGDRNDRLRLIVPASASVGDSFVEGGPGDDVLDASRATMADDEDNHFDERGGSGDDRLDAARSATALDGGPGDDDLRGGPAGDGLAGDGGRDWLRGGPGDDLLVGGTGADRLAGGSGRDALKAGAGDDRLDGGPGEDTASYSDHRHGVRVDLATGRERGEGETDRLRRIEDVQGSQQNDVLLGDDGPNAISGGSPKTSGGDTLDGRGGDDYLSAYSPARMSGGPGADSLYAPGGETARVSCGSGADFIADAPGAAGALLVPDDCESVGADGYSYFAGVQTFYDLYFGRPSISGGEATVELTSRSQNARLQFTVVLRGASGELFGSGTITGQGRLTFPLTAAGQAAAARHAVTTYAVQIPHAAGERWTLRL